MLRALILVVLICASCGDIQPFKTAETLTVNGNRPTTVINIKDDATSSATISSTTTTASNTKESATTDTKVNVTPLNVVAAATETSADQVIYSNNNSKNKNNNMDINNTKENEEKERFYYHPASDKKPRVIEEYNRHFLDGTYEYKYVLSNGVSRYERSYWKLVDGYNKILARKGFYSHPINDGTFLTVFYTADENGYLQDTAKYTNGVPTLPKHLDIPQTEIPKETTATISTTRKPKSTTTTWRPVVKPTEFNWIY